MKRPMVSITREPQDCIEDKCYFWDLGHGKCKWMSTKWKNWFAKNVGIQWHSMEDLNTYITCLLYTSPSPRDVEESRMPSSAW